MRLGVDVGGTFTDAALHDGETLHTGKVPTTPADQSRGVLEAVDAVLEAAGAVPGDVEVFAHGMTVGTNALLEERGARTALVATEGFADVIEIARQNRPSLYRLCATRPEPLVPAELRFEVAERTDPDGPRLEPEPGEIERVADELAAAEAESVAVCLLHSYAHPGNERDIAEALRGRLEGVHVSASHEVLPRFREYERFSTTVVDAYLSPLLGRYLGRLARAARERGLPAPTVMRSSGGVAEIDEAARSGVWSVLSGPAGGAVGAGVLAQLSAGGDALGLDMGGTSCDVCVVEGGEVRRTDAREIGGRILQLPMVDVHTVGAGGGSIGWRDRGGALRVGPRSAGSEPGPACYGRGGTEPTVTDANLVLGRLPADAPLAGGVSLDPVLAERAVGELGSSLALDLLQTAEGIVRVANQEMVQALRVVTVERGVDPRRFALMPFGGAGPLHAAEIAEMLGIERIVCPRASGVLSALGLLASDRRRDMARTVMLSGAELRAERIAEETKALLGTAEAGIEGAVPDASFALRYRGQAFELTIPGDLEPDPAELAQRFEEEHERRYGYRDPDGEIELVDIVLAARIPSPAPAISAGAGATERSRRRVRFSGEWMEAEVVRGEPGPGEAARGPAVVELPEATLVLPPGWAGEVDDAGSFIARRSE